ncbi:hypothetical protein QYS49_08885 [Marivirga salinae]|uniref:Uncharacterized protein n=1 Tax=Marivirga salinarum TaxID=3059078 RepID=A0AA49GCV2_9BACT|nr:hypothetical protein [Marivirga sp. BDSF4-3]WKK77277.2 hypothetical protein QYS49_08885 [Marivirga sp. BDSF4-3]
MFTAAQAPSNYVPNILADTLNPDDYQSGDLVLVTYNYAEEVNDPSVNVTMSEDEYQSLVDYTETTRGGDWIDSFGTLEYYYGSNSYFRNFDGRINRRKGYIEDNALNDDLFDGSTTPEEDSLRIEERIQDGIVKFLEINYPNATPEVNGTDKFFFIEYNVFYGGDAGSIDYFVKYQVENTAPNLSFTLVTGPTQDVLKSSAPAIKTGAYYAFDGTEWSEENNSDYYYLSSADYNAMGAPGQYDNFSSSVLPADYLPELLNQKYPYALEEDQKILIYKYFSSGEVQIRGDLYTFTSGNWEVYGSVIKEQLQFAKEEGVWVPDNTIAYTLTGEDYQQIGNIAIENGDVARGENLQSFGNFYQNFPGGDTHWTDEQIVAVLDQFLKIKYPDLGPGQKFTITYVAYTGSAVELQMNLIQNEEGNYVINE